MRHILLLGGVTLLMALLTTLAWQFDQSRTQAAQAALSGQIDADLQRLEQQYLAQAQALITLLNPHDPLLVAIDIAREDMAAANSLAARDALFQAVVIRIRARLLQAPAANDQQQQEWQRSIDQMNGALHRRAERLSRLGGAG